MKSFKLRLLPLASYLLIGMIFGSAITISVQTVARGNNPEIPTQEIQQLVRVYGILKNNYVEKVDSKKLFTSSINGMATSLDPHTQYFDKKSLEEFNESINGKFVGIGIEISVEDGLVKIVTPIEGTPAYRAGLQAGDLITHIDGASARGLPTSDVVKRVRGKPQTEVILTIVRKGETKPMIIKVIRSEIQTVSVKWKLIEDHYAWLRISHFQTTVTEDITKALMDIYKQQPKLKGLLLDMRNNPGGDLYGALAVSSLFIPHNSVVLKTNGQVAGSNRTYTTADASASQVKFVTETENYTHELWRKIPIIVLVNEASASASEIVSGALQDYQRAIVIGNQTYGKGSVQKIFPIEEVKGTAVKVTTAHYYTPKNKIIQGTGVIPDYFVDEMADDSTHKSEESKPLIPGFIEQKLKLADYATEKDFRVVQALAYFKGQSIKQSSILKVRPKKKEEE
ncbi:MAG: S41 family peptidase [Gammaproteobacteria bacterium]|nr:S41 family peptidase [Gammaproteobacteria bacterium]